VKACGDLIGAVAQSLPSGAGDPRSGIAISVTDIELTIPIEVRLSKGAELRASLPRGRMSTGFVLPHARLFARFEALPARQP
jgi:hypothetical protein